MQPHAMKSYAMNSCPEVHRQLEEVKLKRISVDGGQIARTKHQKHHHHSRFRLVNSISNRLSSLNRRLRGTGSSTYSVRSEFPAPPDGKERRSMARDSVDICPSSGDESPIFNTPESNVTPHPEGSCIDPLVISGMMIAAGELDRLSGSGGYEKSPIRPASSNSHMSLESGVASPSDSLDSPEGCLSPLVPCNTPSSSAPTSGLMSPAVRPPPRPGQRRRQQRSRLSEVTTPEEAVSPPELADNRQNPSFFLHSAVETLQEASDDATSERLFSRYSSNHINAHSPGPSDAGDEVVSIPASEFMSSKPIAPNARTSKDTDITPLEGHNIANVAGGSPSSPGRTFSRSKPDEGLPGQESRLNFDGETCLSGWQDVVLAHERPFHPIEAFPSTGGTEMNAGPVLHRLFEEQRPTGGLIPSSNIMSPSSHLSKHSAAMDNRPMTCHPDTWREYLGEPGHSEPFCPTQTRHNSLEK
ncbi:hypothetical protein F5Y15DRAFT_70051 [Xylariaceae sp. FL0016]|nr:hypothetical protein F5Y15DRAFT_70051 [Xylariaceae sp. FL0016]